MALAVCIAASAGLPKVERVDGVAEMKKPAELSWIPLKPGMEIAENSRVLTKLGSKLLIKLDNGSQITLSENSIFEVIKATNGKYDFKLWNGDARSRVTKLGPTGKYNVRTAVGAAGVRGTDFLLSVADDKTTDLSVYEGTVELVSLSGQKILVGGNQSASISGSGQLSAVSSGTTKTGDDFSADTAASTGLAATSVPLAITAPTPGSVIASRSVTVLGNATPGATVTVGGVPAFVDAGGRFSAVVTLNEGANVITAEAGSEQAAVSVTIDSRRPEITLGSYRELTNVPSVTLTVNTKDGATVTAGSASAVAAGGVATLQVSLTEGDNLITINAADARGLSSQQTIRVVLDTIRPNLTVSSMTSTSVGVRAAGITEPDVTVTANGYPLEVRSDGSFDQVLAGLSASEVTFEAYDKAGNLTRDVRNITGAVDNAPPSLVSLSFSPSSAQAGDVVSVSLLVSDASDVSPTLDLSLSGPGGATLSTTLSASGRSYVGSIATPLTAANGTYAPSSVRLADILGNVTTATPATSLVLSNTAPSAPGSVNAADATTGGALTVTWSAVSASDLQDYTLSQGSSPSGPWTPLYSGNSNSRSLTGLVNGTTYYFQVTARDIAGNVSSGSPVAAGTPSDQVAPSAPGSVNAVGTSSTSISLSWSNSADATSYKVYRSLSAGGGAPWSFVSQVYGTSFNVTGLAPTTTYHFCVTALDNNNAPPTSGPNESAQTSTASGTTL